MKSGQIKHRGEQSWDGPANHAIEVRQLWHFREPMQYLDLTLGKMDHLEASRLYSVEEYKEVVQLLQEAGIKNLGFFVTDQFPETPKGVSIWEGVRAVAKAGFGVNIIVAGNFSSWRAGEYVPYIDELVDSGANAINLIASVPRDYRQYDLPKPGDEYEERLQELSAAIGYAKKRGLQVGGGYPHATEDDVEAAVRHLNFCVGEGMDFLTISDSKGFLTPEATSYFVRRVREGLVRDVPIWYHAHNHFGLATANALAAAAAGAWPQGSANGLGDRGFASLEEVVMALEVLYGVRTGINLKKLPQLCHTVERITGIRNPPYKAIVGEHVYVSSYIGSYVGMLRGDRFTDVNPISYEPEVVGLHPQLIMTYALLSPEAVTAKLTSLGLSTEPLMVQEVQDAIKTSLDTLGNQFPVYLADSAVDQICREVAGRLSS